MSTDGSDEESLDPSSTLSFLIAQFHLFRLKVDNLALNVSTVRSLSAKNGVNHCLYGKVGLRYSKTGSRLGPD